MNFYTSDHHFWHGNVIRYCQRPYTSVEQMNELLIKNWNSIVGPEDTVYYLGDFSLSIKAVQNITQRLMGRKILIAGNHDLCHPCNKKSNTPTKMEKNVKKYLDFGWAEVHLQKEINIGEHKIRLNHLPYLESISESQDQRFPIARPTNDGGTLLCGHVHEKWKSRKTENGALMINVGVDMWDYFPVPEQEIKVLIDNLL